MIVWCRRRRCRHSCEWSRHVFVVDPCCNYLCKSKHLGDRQVMLFKMNLITQPKLPLRLYFFSVLRRVHFQWHQTATTVRETAYRSISERKYPQSTAHIALPHPEPLENVIDDPNQTKEDLTEHDKGDGDNTINDNGWYSCRSRRTTPILHRLLHLKRL